jgi:hypothetical protein
MLFIPENELEKALVRAVKDPGAAPDFYRLLLSSDLLVLGSVEGHETDTEAFNAEAGSNVRLVTGLKDGGQYLPVFSSLARMQDYVKQESKYLSVNGRALLDLTRGAPVILNPASEYGKELTADQVRQLLDGPQALSRNVGDPGYPTALVQMLTALFATRPEIETAWVILVAFVDQPQLPRPVIGIEAASGSETDWPSLIRAIEAAAEKSVPGEMFDVQPVDRRKPTGFTGSLLQSEPFYRRDAASLSLN